MRKHFLIRAGIVGSIIILLGFSFYALIRNQIIDNYVRSLHSNALPISIGIQNLIGENDINSSTASNLLNEADDINYKGIKNLSYVVLRKDDGTGIYSSQNPDNPILIPENDSNIDSERQNLIETILTERLANIESTDIKVIELSDSSYIIRHFTPFYNSENTCIGNIELGFKPIKLSRALFNVQITIIVFILIVLVILFFITFKISALKGQTKSFKSSLRQYFKNKYDNSRKEHTASVQKGFNKATVKEASQTVNKDNYTAVAMNEEKINSLKNKIGDFFVQREKEEEHKDRVKRDFISSYESNLFKSMSVFNKNKKSGFLAHKAHRAG